MSRFGRDVLLCSAFGLLAWDLGLRASSVLVRQFLGFVLGLMQSFKA